MGKGSLVGFFGGWGGGRFAFGVVEAAKGLP